MVQPGIGIGYPRVADFLPPDVTCIHMPVLENEVTRDVHAHLHRSPTTSSNMTNENDTCDGVRPEATNLFQRSNCALHLSLPQVTSFRDQIAHFIFHCHRSKVSPARQPDFREPNVLHRKLIGLVYAWCSLLSSESNHHCHTSIYRGQTATDSGIQLVVTGNWASQIDIFTSVGAVQRTRERERERKRIFTFICKSFLSLCTNVSNHAGIHTDVLLLN